MEHFGIGVNDKSSKVGGKQCLTTPDGYIMTLHIKNELSYLQMQPPTDKELTTMPYVVLTSDVDLNPSVLDSTIDDIQTWSESIPNYPPEEALRSFDRFGNLKSTVMNLHSPALDNALDYFESFDGSIPMSGMYEEYSRPPSTFDWFDANMLELNGPELLPYDPDPDIPLEYKVYDACHRPPTLFNPSPTIDIDIESLTTTGDPPNHALKSSVGLTAQIIPSYSSNLSLIIVSDGVKFSL